MKKMILAICILSLMISIYAMGEKSKENVKNIEIIKESAEQKDNTQILVSNNNLSNTREINTPYEFSVKVKSKEWKKLTREKKIFEAYQIPEQILLYMTTNALLETFISCPFMDDCLGFDEKVICFMSICQKLNVYNELINRFDYKENLIRNYHEICNAKKPPNDSLNEIGVHQTYDFFIRIFSLEMLLNQVIIVDCLTHSEKEELLIILNERFQTTLNNENGYSVNKIGAYILGSHLISDNGEYNNVHNKFLTQYPSELWEKSEIRKSVIKKIIEELLDGGE